MNNAFLSRKMKDCELAHSFCFWKPYKHTRKMAKVLSFETIPHFHWKNDKGVKPANGIQPAFCEDFIYSCFFGTVFLFFQQSVRPYVAITTTQILDVQVR